MRTLGQAIRNAIEIEIAASRFYERLVAKAADKKSREFLREMARQEEEHARTIEAMGERITGGEIPASPDDRVQGVETSPDWSLADTIDLQQALHLALEAENNAALYYDAMSDGTSGEVATFFRDLSETEERHARMLQGLIRELDPR